MKVYALIKIREHPQPDGAGAQQFDLVTFERADRDFSEKEWQYFIPIPVDINIPCGDQFMKEMIGKCGECQYNDPALCDVQKYCRGEWSEGGVEQEPTLIHKRRYKIPVNATLSQNMLKLALNQKKNAAQKGNWMDWASAVQPLNTNITDKVTP